MFVYNNDYCKCYQFNQLQNNVSLHGDNKLDMRWYRIVYSEHYSVNA